VERHNLKREFRPARSRPVITTFNLPAAFPSRCDALVWRMEVAIDREAIRQAAAEHRAAAQRVQKFLEEHPDPDETELRELRILVRLARDASRRLLDATETGPPTL
jgi:hypothetical protein